MTPSKLTRAKILKGFTLIELLVVITIIAILTSIAVMVYGQSRAQARDAKRRGDLQKVAVALEAYYNENGRYPTTTTWQGDATKGTQSCWGGHGYGANGWVPGLVPDYLNVLPADPKPVFSPTGDTDRCYLYQSNGTDYILLAYLTVETKCPVPPSDPLFPLRRQNLASDGRCSYQIANSNFPW